MSYKHYNSQILTGVMLELGPVFMFNVSTQQLYRQTVTASTADGEAAETIEVSGFDNLTLLVLY